MILEEKDNQTLIGEKLFERKTFEWITGLQVTELTIKHKFFEGKHYEEIHGKAEFIKDITLAYLNEDNDYIYSFGDIKLEIVNAGHDLEECALINLRQYFNAEENISDLLSDCVEKGISHLSIWDTGIECKLILEEKHFEKLLGLMQSKSLNLFSFFVDYMSIYSEKAKNSTDDDIFYILKKKYSNDLNSTFGPIKTLYITSNQWKQADEAISIKNNNQNIEPNYESTLANQILFIKNQIIVSTFLIILFVIIF